MIIDIGSIMFNMDVSSGGGTPSWGTDLGQSKDHKFLNKVNKIIVGMVYKNIPNIKDVYCPLGKGGSGQDDYEYVLAGKFDKVYVNNIRVPEAEFVLLIIKRIVGNFHVGRRTIKYNPRIKYKESELNASCFEKMKTILGLKKFGSWFVYDIDVQNQDELHFKAIVVDKEANMTFKDAEERKIFVKNKIKESGVNIDDDVEIIDTEEIIEKKVLKQYSLMNLKEMEKELDSLYSDFQDKFSISKLKSISDSDLPRYMFLSENYNQTNLCWNLEFNTKLKNYFGAIGGGTAYVYGLYYNKRLGSWVTGSATKPILVNEDQAIEIAKKIKQNLICAEAIVKSYGQIEDVSKYAEMHAELREQCGNDVDKLWFKKYLHMIFPSLFSTFYNYEWLMFLNKKCGFVQHDDLYEISGELSNLARRVNLPNAVVSKVLFELFGYPNQDKEAIDEKEENFEMIERKPREVKLFGLNTILYGAPGTGKTYSTTEYAVAIIENRPIRENISEKEREELKQSYRNFVKNGQIVFTTFHQSYGYEDFVQGLRPHPVDGGIQFSYENGVFKEIADKAKLDQNNNYVIIIDEINRGNISKVFGELITLIEDDKRWGEKNQLSAFLPSQEEFVIPNNLYILGTMNSADKSISLIDTALRRRFDFIEVAPNPELIKDEVLRNVLIKLNTILRKVKDSSDLLIGHAYFMNKTKDDLIGIMNKNIIPLLYEYCYDNETKVSDIVEKALDGTSVAIDKDNKQGRIRVK